MTPFISLLRGINVSGHKLIRMTDLKALYESLGFVNVSTYIQSGNVLFEAGRNDPEAIAASIEQAVEKKFGFSVVVILRKPAELARLIKNCPFRGSGKIDESRLYVTFLKAKPSATLVKALEAVAARSPDQYEVVGSEVFLNCPNGYGKTLLSNTFFEKQLKAVATTRNWKTVNTLHVMALHVNE